MVKRKQTRKQTKSRKGRKGNRKTRQRRTKQRNQRNQRNQRGGVMEMSPMEFKTAYLSPPHAPTGQSVAELAPREQYLRSPYGEYQKGGFQDERIQPMSLKEAYPGKNLDPSGQPAY